MLIYSKRSIVFVVLLLWLLNVPAQNSRFSQQSQKFGDPDVLLAKTKELGSEVQATTTTLLQYEKGISLEVRRGVSRLVKSCIAQEVKQPTTPSENTNEYLQRKVLEANALNINLSSRLEGVSAGTSKLAEEKCAASFPPFFVSNACNSSQQLNTAVKSLQSSLTIYFDLVKARYQLYREVATKEADGCVKKGFTDRLLKANEEHVIGQEDLARKKLLELINSADETYRLSRQ
jgi:hypothetical protein